VWIPFALAGQAGILSQHSIIASTDLFTRDKI
jgi:hypothetical protein